MLCKNFSRGEECLCWLGSLGPLPCSAQCNSLGQALGLQCGFISRAKELGKGSSQGALQPWSLGAFLACTRGELAAVLCLLCTSGV